MRTYVRGRRPDHPPRGRRLLLRVGRAARRHPLARTTRDRRCVGCARGELRGEGARRGDRDERRAGATPLPPGGRRRTADVCLRRGEQSDLPGLRRHVAARRRALDRRGVSRRPRRPATVGAARRDCHATEERRSPTGRLADHDRDRADEVPRQGGERRGEAGRAAPRATGGRARISPSATGRAALGSRLGDCREAPRRGDRDRR